MEKVIHSPKSPRVYPRRCFWVRPLSFLFILLSFFPEPSNVSIISIGYNSYKEKDVGSRRYKWTKNRRENSQKMPRLFNKPRHFTSFYLFKSIISFTISTLSRLLSNGIYTHQHTPAFSSIQRQFIESPASKCFVFP